VLPPGPEEALLAALDDALVFDAAEDDDACEDDEAPDAWLLADEDGAELDELLVGAKHEALRQSTVGSRITETDRTERTIGNFSRMT
jgi:hypothetical protein